MTVATCTPTGRPSARVRVPSSRRCGVYWLQLAGGLNLLRVCGTELADGLAEGRADEWLHFLFELPIPQGTHP